MIVFTEGVRIFKDNQESNRHLIHELRSLPETVEVTLGSKDVRH